MAKLVVNRKKKNSEQLAEVVVPAEITEESIKKPKKAKVETKQNKEEAKQVKEVDSNIGVYSDEILSEMHKKVSSAEEVQKNYELLLRYSRTNEILWGEVYGFDSVDDVLHQGYVKVLYNGIDVSIPALSYFEPGFDFGKNYKDLSVKDKINRHKILIKYQIGAKVCFLAKHIQRESINNGNYSGEDVLHIIGSRKEAMALIRDIFYLHKNYGSTKNIEVGNIIDANVLAVREDKVLVECAGVETYIDAYNISEEFVENCHDFLKVGDRIKVMIRKLYINQDDSIYMEVTARTNQSSKLIRSLKIKSGYSAVVKSFNKTKNSYTATIAGGVKITFTPKDVVGGIPLINGDKIFVTIKEISDNFVYGKDVMKI